MTNPFKVGDRVQWKFQKKNYSVNKGHKATVVAHDDKRFGESVVPIEWLPVVWDEGTAQCNGGYNHYDFGLVQEYTSPIKTVTSKKIVPGRYGRLQIPTSCLNGKKLDDQHGLCVGVPYSANWTSKELRDAARVLNDLADYLEEQEK